MSLARRVITLVILAGLVSVGYGRRDKKEDEPFLLIVGVVPGSIADELKIQEGDVLRAYNGNGVQSIEELEAAKRLTIDSAEVIIDRGEETLSFIFPFGQMGLYLEQRLPELEYASDAVLIQGVGPLNEEDEMNNSFILSLRRVEDILRDTLDYATLMGLSGSAFRFQMDYDWNMVAIQASEGFRTDIHALEALGYEYRFLDLALDYKNVEEIREAVIQSIDAGSPVIAFKLIEFPDWGIITGYQKSGRELVVRAYDSRREGYTLAESFPSRVCIIEGRTVPPTLRASKIHSFKLAQEILEKQERVGNYYVGERGLKNWIQNLETGDFYNYNDEDFDKVIEANAWMFIQLIEDRKHAATYLNGIADEFPDVEDKLKRIAQLYTEEAEHLDLAFVEDSCIVWPEDLESPYDWTPQMRISEVNYLRFAVVKEKEALKLWREVNEIYNPEVPEDSIPAPPEETGTDTTPEDTEPVDTEEPEDNGRDPGNNRPVDGAH